MQIAKKLPPKEAQDFPRERDRLWRELEEKVDGEVRFDDGSRAIWSTDGSNYRHIPIGVVLPKTTEAVVETVACCRKYHVPIVARGGGTSLTGASCNVAVVIDTSKYLNRVLEVNPSERWAWVEPGTILDTLREGTKVYGLTFGPDPATHDRCVLGGMIGNNSCGTHAQMAGRVADNIHELDILTYDGTRLTVGETSPEQLEDYIRQGGRRSEIYAGLKHLADRYASLIRETFPKIPRRISGYGIDELLPENGFNVARSLVGSEGTCVLILGAKGRLVYSPRKKCVVVLGYDDIFSAADRIPDVNQFGPMAVEALDPFLIKLVRDSKAKDSLDVLPKGNAFLMVEFGGETNEEAALKGRFLLDHFRKNGHPRDRLRLADEEQAQKKLWEVRESALGVTAYPKGHRDSLPGWEDSAVPPEKLGIYLREFQKLLHKYDYECSMYGHFGQGCLHCSIDFDLKTHEGIENYRAFVFEAAGLVLGLGGSFSGEHGDGQSRGELLPLMYGDELVDAFRQFKSIWDPEWKMNPGRKIDARKLDQDLKWGAKYDPLRVRTHFSFPEDKGDFAHATSRCVGAGVCRRTGEGIMCPSYQATHDEKHSTRGRSRILFEMMLGQSITRGWKDENVKDALDLCLSCKGCKGECPVQVDMATYKAEFLSHYYAGRLRPLSGYAMGGIFWWARMASHFPRLANFVTHTKGLSSVVKRMGGISPQREMPRFATETFKRWFSNRPRRPDAPPVILWADTFTNHFRPEIAKAAVAVLEDAGFQVMVPHQPLCCGRPLYDYGFLSTAKRLLRKTLKDLHQPIQDGVPVIGLEPSCVSVFRDEMTNLLPNDERAKRLAKQVFMLSEFLIQKTDYRPPQLARSAVVQAHCHHKSVLNFQDEVTLLKKMGLQFQVLDTGCCGLAGSFGFERDHFPVSVDIAARALIPAINRLPPDTMVIANGFSCQTQIEDLTHHKAFNLAQVIEYGLREREEEKRLDIERKYGTTNEDAA